MLSSRSLSKHPEHKQSSDLLNMSENKTSISISVRFAPQNLAIRANDEFALQQQL